MATAVDAGVGWEDAKNMTKWELEGWTLALLVAEWKRKGGSYDYETGEWIQPPEPTATGA